MHEESSHTHFSHSYGSRSDACKGNDSRNSNNDAVEKEKRVASIGEFNELLAQLPLSITSTKYAIQDEQYKSLYPDMLKAVIQNNTGEDIKNATIAFVARDGNKLPVKIKGGIDFSDGAYVKEVKYSYINLILGATYGDSYGYKIDASCNIVDFKVSYGAFDGITWQNPTYDEWRKFCEGKKLNRHFYCKYMEPH